MEPLSFPTYLINLFIDHSRVGKKKGSEIAVLVVKEICPGSWLEIYSAALARDGENWRTGKSVGSGGWKRRS